MLPVGAIIFLGAVCVGMFSTCGTSKDSKTTPLALAPEQDRPQLTSDGINLYVNGTKALSYAKQDQDFISDLALDREKGKDTLRFRYRGGLISRTGTSIHDQLWCMARKSVLFIQKENENEKVWQWTEASGFQSVTDAFPSLTDLTVSPDGATIAARLDSGQYFGVSASNSFLLFSLVNHEHKKINYDDSADSCVPISLDEVLVDGHNRLGNQTYRWRVTRSKLTPIIKDASLVSTMTVGPAIYSIHKTAKKFEIVKLNPGLDSWSASYELPKGWDAEKRDYSIRRITRRARR